VQAYVSCPSFGETVYPVLFLIDTGSTTTTLLDSDVLRLGIDVKKLKKRKMPTVGVGGLVPTYMLENVTLIFDRGRGRFHLEHLDTIDVLVHGEKDDIDIPFSLFGADLLKRFRFDYCDDIFYLEK